MAKLKTIKFKQGGEVIDIDVPAGGVVDWQDVENKPELYDKTEINAMLGNKVDKETTQEQEVKGMVNFRGGITTDYITNPSSVIINSHAFIGINADKKVFAGEYYEGLMSSDDNRLATRKYVNDNVALKVNTSDIVDDLVSTATDKPLSAKQGKVLQDTKESLTNKAINFSVVNDTKYPTTKAVKDLLDATLGDIDSILDSILGV